MGAGCLLLEEAFTNTIQPVADFLCNKHLDKRVPQEGEPKYSAFEGHNEVLETVPIDFLMGGIMLVASRLSSSTGALGA